MRQKFVAYFLAHPDNSIANSVRRS